MNRLKLTFPVNDFTRLILINLKLQNVDFDVEVNRVRINNPSDANLYMLGILGGEFSLSICRDSLSRCGIDEAFLRSLYLKSSSKGNHTYLSTWCDASDNPPQ